MLQDLTALGYGLVVFAIIIGVGSIILSNFGSAVADCTNVGSVGTWTYNTTSGLCGNTSITRSPPAGAVNSYYLLGQLGSSGLASWTPAIIAMAIGLLFLGAFMLKGGKKGRY